MAPRSPTSTRSTSICATAGVPLFKADRGVPPIMGLLPIYRCLSIFTLLFSNVCPTFRSLISVFMVEAQALSRFLRACDPVAKVGGGDEDGTLEAKVEKLTDQLSSMQEQLAQVVSRVPGGAAAASARDGQ